MKTSIVVATIGLVTVLAYAEDKAALNKGQSVPSPNRTLAHTLVVGKDLGAANSTVSAPLVWIDAKGKTLGRVKGNAAIIPYNGQLMSIDLGAEVDPQQASFKNYAMTWANWESYYTTTDCTGTPYFRPYPTGTAYYGMAIKEADGKYYVMVVSLDRAIPITYRSVYNYTAQSCYRNDWIFTSYLSPVETAFPADRLGIPPFSMK